jgi:hypothetical protein
MKATLYTLGILFIIGGIIFIPLKPEWYGIEIRTPDDSEGNMSAERYVFLELFDHFGFVLLLIGTILILGCYSHSKIMERRNNTN